MKKTTERQSIGEDGQTVGRGRLIDGQDNRRMVDQGRDPIIFEAEYLVNRAR